MNAAERPPLRVDRLRFVVLILPRLLDRDELAARSIRSSSNTRAIGASLSLPVMGESPTHERSSALPTYSSDRRTHRGRIARSLP